MTAKEKERKRYCSKTLDSETSGIRRHDELRKYPTTSGEIRLYYINYLREVTPYFRKASIIQEVGWELQRGFLSATPPPPKSPPRADTRYLPLQLCRLTRAHPSSDPVVATLRQKLSPYVPKAFVFHDLTDDPADPFRDARKPFECSLVQTPVAKC
ncbi:beta-1-syntrophin isoform X3, partial [Vespula squamosa]